RRATFGCLCDRVPDFLQVVQVPLQLFGRTADARSAYDGAHSFGDLHTIERLAQLLAVLAFDSPRNTACAGVVRHEDEEASCEADERRERRALVAALFLLDLDDERSEENTSELKSREY